MTSDPKADLAIAGGAIAVALIDKLVRQSVIDRGTGMQILADAQKRCSTIGATDAEKIIRDALTQMRIGG